MRGGGSGDGWVVGMVAVVVDVTSGPQPVSFTCTVGIAKDAMALEPLELCCMRSRRAVGEDHSELATNLRFLACTPQCSCLHRGRGECTPKVREKASADEGA